MKKSVLRISISIIALIFVLSVLSAMTVNVRTLPNHKVNIRLTADSGVLLDSKIITTDSTGIASMDYLGSQADIKVQAIVTKDGDRILFENFGSFKTNKNLYLQAIPGEISYDYKSDDEAKAAESSKNQTIENNETTQIIESNETEIKEGVTGLTISFEKVTEVTKNINWTYVVYAVLSVFFIAGIIMFTGYIRKRRVKVIEISTKGKVMPVNPIDETRIEEAERKLKEAEQEINAIKNRKKDIGDAQRQLQEAKEKLTSLGVDFN